MEPVVINGAVEGVVDETVFRRLARHVGARPGTIYGRNGKDDLLRRLFAYNAAARFQPWAILIDLDDDCKCAPPAKATWLPDPAPMMCFRIAVRQVEAWLLADWERFSGYFALPASALQGSPEDFKDAKRAVVDLARKSRRNAIVRDMIPGPKSGRRVGPAYTSRLIEFISDEVRGWRPDVAAADSGSLGRCLRCLRRLAGKGLQG